MRYKKKRFSKVLSFGFSIMVSVCLCVLSVFNVSAAQTYNIVFNDSYDVTCIGDGLEVTCNPYGSSSTHASWQVVSDHLAKAYLFEFPFERGTGNNIFANLNFQNKNHITWRVGFPKNLKGAFDPNQVVLTFNAAYTESLYIHPSSVVEDTSGYTSIYYDFDLPSYVDHLSYVTLFVEFNVNVTNFYVETYTFTLNSTSDVDEIIDQFGDDYQPPDETIPDDYYDSEAGLLEDIGPSIDGILGDWADLPSTMFEYQTSFFAVASLFNALAGIPFFSALLIISVCIGIFALLLGAVGHFASKG